MKFRRRSPRTFASDDGGYRIKRPSGRGTDRAGLSVESAGCDYEVRLEGEQVWLVDGDREVGYAKGAQEHWTVIVGGTVVDVDQPQPGVNHSYVRIGGRRVGQFAGNGFPLRSFASEGEIELNDEHTAFLAAIVALGWRESDRGLFGSNPDVEDD